MNRTSFIEKLEEETKLENEKCVIIADVLEEIPIIGKKNKEKIASVLEEKLEVSAERAEELYEISSSIIMGALKDKLKHPFRSIDD